MDVATSRSVLWVHNAYTTHLARMLNEGVPSGPPAVQVPLASVAVPPLPAQVPRHEGGVGSEVLYPVPDTALV